MTGIMEQILAELQKQTALMMAEPTTATQSIATNGGGQTVVAAQPATAVDPFAAAPATQPITEAMVMGLIEPHLENAPLKASLSAVLASMGIARLPEARPDQYAALYAAFQGVIAQHAAPVAAAATSII